MDNHRALGFRPADVLAAFSRLGDEQTDACTSERWSVTAFSLRSLGSLKAWVLARVPARADRDAADVLVARTLAAELAARMPAPFASIGHGCGLVSHFAPLVPRDNPLQA